MRGEALPLLQHLEIRVKGLVPTEDDRKELRYRCGFHHGMIVGWERLNHTLWVLKREAPKTMARSRWSTKRQETPGPSGHTSQTRSGRRSGGYQRSILVSHETSRSGGRGPSGWGPPREPRQHAAFASMCNAFQLAIPPSGSPAVGGFSHSGLIPQPRPSSTVSEPLCGS